MPRIAQHFTDLVRWIKQPVVVFVDDLDRCEADYVVRFLEAVQTLYREAPVCYVVAADRRWLRASYKETYEIFNGSVGEPGLPLDHLFMEKIFQLSAPVPRITSSYRSAYWEQLLKEGKVEIQSALNLEGVRNQALQDLSRAKSDRDIMATVERQRGTGLRELVYRAEAVKRLVGPDVHAATEHRLKDYHGLVGFNPRAMKRLVNAYIIQQAIVILTGVEIPPDKLPLWTILSLRWPVLADYLKQHPAAVSDLVTFRDKSDREKRELLERISDPGLRSLFENPHVQDVVSGEGLAACLDEETVRKCAHLSS